MKKKKVAYGLGVVGLVPSLMMPSAAQAVTASIAHAQKGGAKTVSLDFTGAATGCTGDASKTTHNVSEQTMTVWHTAYSQSQCIGTVRGQIGKYMSLDTGLRVRVWHNGNLVGHGEVNFSHPISKANIGINGRFADPAKVCDAWYHSGTWGSGLCATVG
jgi:hypothetical protein